jgi:hypothetical protein
MAWGAGGGADASCFQQTGDSWPGVILRGTAAAVVRAGATGNHFDIDLTVRLQRNAKEETFRVRMADIPAESVEHVACLVLDAQPTDPFGNTIATVFNIPPTRVPRVNALSVRRYSELDPISGTESLSAIADIVLHYVNTETRN